MPTYRVTDQTTGIEWKTEDGETRRVESGEECNDLPEEAAANLLEKGVIEPADKVPEVEYDTAPLEEE